MNPTVKSFSVGFIYPLGTLVLKPFGCGSSALGFFHTNIAHAHGA
jgi:hypothetical protein